MHPRLFNSLMLLDPAFLTSEKGEVLCQERNFNMTIQSRDLWNSRVEAAAHVESAFPTWNPRVRELMVRYGFRDLPTALYPNFPAGADAETRPVTLTTTKYHMASMLWRSLSDCERTNGRFVVNRQTHGDLDPELSVSSGYRPEVPSSTARMPSLRPPTLFLLGRHTNGPWRGAMKRAADSTGTGVGGSGGKPEGRVQTVWMEGGHMFPFTAVEETGLACASWLGTEMERYGEEETRWEERRKLSGGERALLRRSFQGLLDSKL